MIGRGNFADVQLARERSTGKVDFFQLSMTPPDLEICISANKNVKTLQVYALKVMKKVGENVPSFYCEERDIMARTTSLWHTKLDYAFQVGNLW